MTERVYLRIHSPDSWKGLQARTAESLSIPETDR